MHLQLHFLATRFASMRRMRGLGGSWVLDRTWYEDAEIFARGLFEQGYMTSDEWTLYRRLYAELLHSPAARPPRLLIYLQGPLDVITERIAVRGRPSEKEVAPEYWRALHERYERWIAHFRHCPVLFIDVREYDLVADSLGGGRDLGARATAAGGRAAADGAVARGVAPHRVRVNARAPDGTPLEDSLLSRGRPHRRHSLVAR